MDKGKPSGATMRRTKDGAGWMYRGFRIENIQHRHAIGGGPAWAVTRHGIRRVVGLPTRKDACDYVDDAIAALAAVR